MRRLNRKQTFKIVKEFDAFPKVPEDYQEATATGGTVAILTFALIAILVVSEFRYYTATSMKYQYDVDSDLNSKLQINVDMTAAMSCSLIGADVVDVSGDVAINFDNSLRLDPAHFQMSEVENKWHSTLRALRLAAAGEKAIQDLLFQKGYMGLNKPRPVPNQMNKPFDACRIHGSVTVNKVAGNFHVTMGKNIPFNRGHAHIAIVSDSKAYNFSHRVDHFSVGKPIPGVVSPLDGDLKITEDSRRLYQYFLQIVPTKLNTNRVHMDTYQYSVTEQERTIDHTKGSHGISGIFFKYELSSLVISVNEVHEPYWQFLVRLCGIIGGVFATSGMLHAALSSFYDIICCRFRRKKVNTASTIKVPGHELVSGSTEVQSTSLPTAAQ